MAACSRCGVETELYNGSVPVCLECSEQTETKRKSPQSEQIRRRLVGRLVEATAKLSRANHTFNDLIDKFPSGLPHPDGVQRIKNASAELASARREMMTAHKRLNEFVDRGTVPDDLEQTG